MGFGLSQYIHYYIYIGVFIAVLLTFVRVEYGLFFLIPLAPIEGLWVKMWEWPLGTHLIDILVIAMLVSWSLKRKEKFLEKSSLNWPIFFLLLITFIGVLIGSGLSFDERNIYYLAFWKNFALMPLIYLIAFNNIKKEKDIRILIYLMALSMIAIYFHFHSNLHDTATHFNYKDRVSGFTDLGPNETAAFAAQGGMFFFGLWLIYTNMWSRILLGAAFVAAMYMVLYSYSRSGYLAVAGAFLFVGLLKDRRILIVLLLFFALWKTVLPVSVVERIEMTHNEETELDHASQLRIDIWREGLSEFAENPLGAGFNKARSMGFGESGHMDAHNMFVKMLIELSVPGLILFVLLYFLSFKSGWRLYRVGESTFARGLGLGFTMCVLVNAITNFFGQNWLFFNVSIYYWVFSALVERARVTAQSGAEKGLALKQVPAPAEIQQSF